MRPALAVFTQNTGPPWPLLYWLGRKTSILYQIPKNIRTTQLLLLSYNLNRSNVSQIDVYTNYLMSEHSVDPDQRPHSAVFDWVYTGSLRSLSFLTNWTITTPPRSAAFFRGDWSWNIFYGHSLPSADSRRAVVSFRRKNVHSTG